VTEIVFGQMTIPAGKNLLKVGEITLEQRLYGLCSSVILLTLDRYLRAGIALRYFREMTGYFTDFEQVFPVGLSSNLFKVSKITL